MYLKNVKKKNKFLIKLSSLLYRKRHKLILFNRTLLCAETVSMFSHDHYDDALLDRKILIDKNFLKQLNLIYNFKIEDDVIKISYDNFKLNIYLINFDLKYFNFKGFILNSFIFKKTKKIRILNNYYFTPKSWNTIFNKIFSPSFFELLNSKLYDKRRNYIIRHKNFLLSLVYLIFFFKKYSRYELNHKIDELCQLNIRQFLNSGYNKFKKKKIFKIDIKKFKKLKFDPTEFNYYFRKKHYELLTKDFKNFKIKDIITFIKKRKLKFILKKIVETHIVDQVSEPIYLNKKFWRTGNNFYINPIRYGFKKKVIGYENVNNYVQLKKKPQVYTSLYYKNLKNMNNSEIENILKQNPIAINKYGFLSGRHRVAAMIGRLLRGEKYIPFYVYKV